MAKDLIKEQEHNQLKKEVDIIKKILNNVMDKMEMDAWPVHIRVQRERVKQQKLFLKFITKYSSVFKMCFVSGNIKSQINSWNKTKQFYLL